MNCTVSAFFGVGLLGASVLTMSVSKEQTDSLRRVLTPEAAKTYNRIVKERTSHYFQGLVLGLFLTFAFLYHTKITNMFHKSSLAFGVTLSVTMFYYMLMPKSDYMLRHLNSAAENEAWLRIYKTMRTRNLLGFVFGALASIPLSMAFC